MKLQELKNALQEYSKEHEMGVFGKIRTKISGRNPYIKDIADFLTRAGESDRELTLKEELDFGSLLFFYDPELLGLLDDEPEHVRYFLHNLTKVLWPTNPEHSHQAMSILNKAGRLTPACWNAMKHARQYNIVKAAKLFAWLPKEFFNEETFKFINKTTGEYGVAQDWLEELQKFGVLTQSTLTIVSSKNHYLVQKAIDEFIALKKEGIFTDAAAKQIFKILQASIPQRWNAEISAYTYALLILKENNIFSEDTVNMLHWHMPGVQYKEVAAAFGKLKEAGIFDLELANILKRLHFPDDVAEVMIILHRAGRLDSTFRQSIDQHPQPHLLREPLEKLRDANLIHMPEYTYVVFTKNNANEIVDVLIPLKKANINFELAHLLNPALREMTKLLIDNHLLTQENYEAAKEVKNGNFTSVMEALKESCKRSESAKVSGLQKLGFVANMSTEKETLLEPVQEQTVMPKFA